jgi:hypothetical protein
MSTLGQKSGKAHNEQMSSALPLKVDMREASTSELGKGSVFTVRLPGRPDVPVSADLDGSHLPNGD